MLNKEKSADPCRLPKHIRWMPSCGKKNEMRCDYTKQIFEHVGASHPTRRDCTYNIQRLVGDGNIHILRWWMLGSWKVHTCSWTRAEKSMSLNINHANHIYNLIFEIAKRREWTTSVGSGEGDANDDGGGVEKKRAVQWKDVYRRYFLIPWNSILLWLYF